MGCIQANRSSSLFDVATSLTVATALFGVTVGTSFTLFAESKGSVLFEGDVGTSLTLFEESGITSLFEVHGSRSTLIPLALIAGTTFAILPSRSLYCVHLSSYSCSSPTTSRWYMLSCSCFAPLSFLMAFESVLLVNGARSVRYFLHTAQSAGLFQLSRALSNFSK